jgi:hypothetical protein
VPKIASLIPDLPRDAAAAVDGCLVKQRDGRHADLTPLLTVLGHYADPDVPGGNRGGRVVSDIEIGEAKLSTISAGNAEVMSERPREGRSRPAKLITAAATVVVVSALAGYGLRKQRAESVAAESVAGTAAGTASDAPAESSSADVGESSPLNVSASQPIEPSARASATASSPRPHSMSVQPPPLVPTASATALNTTASAAPSGEKKKGIVEELPY